MIHDNEFYDEIVHPIEGTMMACIWRVVQNHANALDVLQEALEAIWRKRKTVAKHPKPEALILRICRDKAIDSLRRSTRRTKHELSYDLHEENRANTVLRMRNCALSCVICPLHRCVLLEEGSQGVGRTSYDSL